jgi:HTH-type transcriptional regulator, sugar sensing transcriptional regulator
MKEELKKFGLTENESRVYLALVELGDSTATPIRNKTDLHTSRVYESLSSLIEKGLVSYFLKNNVKHFKSQDPDVMLDILDEKREQLKKIMPQIKGLSNKKETDYSVSLYEGYKSFKQLYDHLLFKLKKGDEILVFGAQPESADFLSRTFFKQYGQIRINKKVKMRIIFNHNAKKTAKEYSKLPFTNVRILPKEKIIPTAMDIYPDKVSILLSKDKPIVFHIDCREVAQSYKQYFEFLWRGSSKIWK